MSNQDDGQKSLSLGQILKMSLAGASMAFLWIIQGAYWTPMLLNLGMPKSWTSIVWMAGPLTGLFQPFIGAYSDTFSSPYGRRRPFIIAGSAAAIASLLIFTYAVELGNVISFGHGNNNVSLAVAVFSVFTFQISCAFLTVGAKAIVIDVTPFHQQKRATAICQALTGSIAIFTLFVGSFDLPSAFAVTWDRAHLKLMSMFSSICVIACVITTCLSVREKARPLSASRAPVRFKSIAFRIWRAILILPKPIQLLCAIALFAEASTYPLFHYATTWVAQFSTGRHQPFVGDDISAAQQRGSLAIGLSEIVALITTGVTLKLVGNQRKSIGKHLLIFQFFGFAANMWSTLLVWNGVTAIIVLMCVGLPLGAGQWVTGALLAEHAVNHEELHTRSASVLKAKPLDGSLSRRTRTAVIHSETLDSNQSIASQIEPQSSFSAATALIEPDDLEASSGGNLLSAGVLLGISTIASTFGKLVFALVAGSIFSALDGASEMDDSGEIPPPEGMIAGDARDSVGWIMRLGGVLAIVAGLLSLKVQEAGARGDYLELAHDAKADESDPGPSK